MNLICIFFGIIFMIFGLMFVCGKGHIHLASWKNMSQEERETIKIVPLCHNIGEVIVLSGLIFMLKGLCPSFENHWFVAAMIVWFIVAGFDLWYIEKSDRYYKKGGRSNE